MQPCKDLEEEWSRWRKEQEQSPKKKTNFIVWKTERPGLLEQNEMLGWKEMCEPKKAGPRPYAPSPGMVWILLFSQGMGNHWNQGDREEIQLICALKWWLWLPCRELDCAGWVIEAVTGSCRLLQERRGEGSLDWGGDSGVMVSVQMWVSDSIMDRNGWWIGCIGRTALHSAYEPRFWSQAPWVYILAQPTSFVTLDK